MAREKKPEELTEEELAEAHGEPLPDREALSVIRGGGFKPLPPDFPLDPDPAKSVTPLDDPPPGA